METAGPKGAIYIVNRTNRGRGEKRELLCQEIDRLEGCISKISQQIGGIKKKLKIASDPYTFQKYQFHLRQAVSGSNRLNSELAWIRETFPKMGDSYSVGRKGVAHA